MEVQLCKYYVAGGCRQGESCLFAHVDGADVTNSKTGIPVAAQHPETTKSPPAAQPYVPSEADRSFYRWRRMLPKNPAESGSLFGQRLAEFFRLGHILVQGDLGILQETIRLLATEGGLLSIRELIEQRIPLCRSHIAQLELWRTCIRPLFMTLTEQRVSRSTLLEMSTGAIFNAILGYDAKRLQPLFHFLFSVADDWHEPSIKSKDGSKSEYLELCSSILCKVVDCNTQVLVNSAIPPIVSRLKSLLDQVWSGESDFWILQTDKNIEYIQRRLSIVKGVSEPQPPPSQTLSHATFELRRDLPGELSADGPRHDNDYADCTKIRILPTMSEIKSARQDYRPYYDPAQLHLPGIQGLIDRHFRLLRDDMVGQLKESIGYELDQLNDSPKGSQEKRGIRTYSYCISRIVEVTCKKRQGLEFHLEIEQPFRASPRSTMDSEEYWTISRRLETGALVCVLQKSTAIFCVVSESTVRPDPNRPKKQLKTTDGYTVTSTKRDLYSNSDFSYVKLCLAEPQTADVEVMIRAFKSGLSSQRILVEFPGVLLPSFQSTLLALQHIYRTTDLPFGELLVQTDGDAGNDAGVQTILPPLYSTKPQFTFNLRSITNNGEDLLYSPQTPPNPQVLMSKSKLDHGQALACLNALRREFQVIQGPPGTGKSWTGEAILKVLVDNRKSANIGPILCVCYTNHALDQLLEHLWRGGTTQIIRIGSRSKSTVLQDVNLRKVAQEIERTRAEKKEAYKHGSKLEGVQNDIKVCLNRIENATTAKSIKEYLVERGQTILHDAIFGQEAEAGWTKVARNENESLEDWIRAGAVTDQIRLADILENIDPNTLTQDERQELCFTWAQTLMEEHIQEFVSLESDYRQAKSEFERVQREIDLRVLSQCQVIGVTTTGLAKNLEMLRKLDSKVLLCEEAGEVLESHVLTAMLPSLEHVILIGDHLQLRPQVANYELSVENPLGQQYSLDVSLFERLVKPVHLTHPKLPFDTLTVQRRMHPSISTLIRETIYSDLEDATSLSDYPDVVGMRKRLFWFDHKSPENKPDPTQPLNTSHTNDFEVEMVSALVSHLVRQNVYSHDQIAVLTPYLGQLYKLRKRLRNSFEIVLGERDIEDLDKQGLEIEAESSQEVLKKPLGKFLTLATVDNFQGEEAEVVLISLVRSNPDGKCGFLRTSNRINVLLSRAKHGMYILGDSRTYVHVPMWSDVISMLKADGNFGTRLPLQCPRHKDTTIEVANLDDFGRLSPEAGCNAQCLQRLPCGHTCKSPCHSDLLHGAVRCLDSCPRSRPFCNHPCPNPCGDRCEERCSKILKDEGLKLPCGHIANSPRCWQTRDPGSIKCMELTEKSVPGCGHLVKVLCCADTSKNMYECKAVCNHPLPCGHLCLWKCQTCRSRVDGKVTVEFHPPCAALCGRAYSTCAHSCSKPCHPGEECPPCEMPCEIQCSHSRCGKRCSEPCAPCAVEECCSACPHSQCTMPCAAPCNWTPCSKRCTKILPCGHQCPSICGEICPESEYCQICAPENIQAMVVDMIEMRQYRDICLDEDPCIFPDCMHVLTVASMDGQLGMNDHYHVTSDGTINGIKEPESSTEIKSCPMCRGSLRNLARYGRLVRQALLDESTKKFIAWSHRQSLDFEKRLLDEQERLENVDVNNSVLTMIGRHGQLSISGNRWSQLLTISEWTGHDRYVPLMRLYREIGKYVHHVAIEEQPYQRVYDLVEHARRCGTRADQFPLNPSKLETRGLLLAGSLLLRCDFLIIRDFVTLRQKMEENFTDIVIDLTATLNDCDDLIQLARDKKYARHEAEGHIYFVQFVALVQLLFYEKQTQTLEESTEMNELRSEGEYHLVEARTLLELYKGSTSHLVKDFEAAESMLRDFASYAPVSVEEKRSVWKAMSRELRGTGRWYTCENGHPFTIGECGMPNEEAKCPECDAAIGGRNYQPASGVRRDTEMDTIGAIDTLVV